MQFGKSVMNRCWQKIQCQQSSCTVVALTTFTIMQQLQHTHTPHHNLNRVQWLRQHISDQLTVNFKVAKTVWWYCECVSSSTGSQRTYVIPQTLQLTVSWSFWPKSFISFTKHISTYNGTLESVCACYGAI